MDAKKYVDEVFPVRDTAEKADAATNMDDVDASLIAQTITAYRLLGAALDMLAEADQASAKTWPVETFPVGSIFVPLAKFTFRVPPALCTLAQELRRNKATLVRPWISPIFAHTHEETGCKEAEEHDSLELDHEEDVYDGLLDHYEDIKSIISDLETASTPSRRMIENAQHVLRSGTIPAMFTTRAMTHEQWKVFADRPFLLPHDNADPVDADAGKNGNDDYDYDYGDDDDNETVGEESTNDMLFPDGYLESLPLSDVLQVLHKTKLSLADFLSAQGILNYDDGGGDENGGVGACTLTECPIYRWCCDQSDDVREMLMAREPIRLLISFFQGDYREKVLRHLRTSTGCPIQHTYRRAIKVGQRLYSDLRDIASVIENHAPLPEPSSKPMIKTHVLLESFPYATLSHQLKRPKI